MVALESATMHMHRQMRWRATQDNTSTASRWRCIDRRARREKDASCAGVVKAGGAAWLVSGCAPNDRREAVNLDGTEVGGRTPAPRNPFIGAPAGERKQLTYAC